MKRRRDIRIGDRVRVGNRVTTRPSLFIGTVRHIEDGAACVRWNDLHMIYT